MINHKHQCIFIHLPRTGGSSIEIAIERSWWKVHPPSKHLNAFQAKQIYEPYWDDYFKFSFVRNPWDRMVSFLKYNIFYGVSLDSDGKINTEKYFQQFNKIEYDYRFFNQTQFKDFNIIENSVYKNILGDDMDFVGRFENLQEDWDQVCDILNIQKQNLLKSEESIGRKNYQEYYNENEKQKVAKAYALDIDEYKYKF